MSPGLIFLALISGILAVNAAELFYLYKIKKEGSKVRESISSIDRFTSTVTDSLQKTFSEYNESMKNIFTEDFPKRLDDFYLREFALLATLYLDESTIPIAIRLSEEEYKEGEAEDNSGLIWFYDAIKTKNLQLLAKIASALLSGLEVDERMAEILLENGFFEKAANILKNYSLKAFILLKEIVESKY